MVSDVYVFIARNRPQAVELVRTAAEAMVMCKFYSVLSCFHEIAYRDHLFVSKRTGVNRESGHIASLFMMHTEKEFERIKAKAK